MRVQCQPCHIHTSARWWPAFCNGLHHLSLIIAILVYHHQDLGIHTQEDRITIRAAFRCQIHANLPNFTSLTIPEDVHLILDPIAIAAQEQSCP